MTRDIDDLLRSTTPETPRFDLETLHRRGVRRRRGARTGAAVGLAALVAIAIVVQSPTQPVVTIEPAGPGDTETATSDGEPAGPDESDTDVPDGEPGTERQAPGDASLPFGITEADVAEMAARLPGPDADGSDAEVVRGTDLGEDPYLHTENIHCAYREGEGASVDVPDEGRVRTERFGSDMTPEDVVAECLDSDAVRAGGWHAPGPFTLCAASIEPAVREQMRSSVPSDRERFPRGDDPEPPRFLAALSYEANCAGALSDANPPIVLHGQASLETFNDRRRVEAAMKAIEWGCLDGREAVTLAIAATDRMGGQWQLDTPAALDLTTTRPCWGLQLDQKAAMLSVHPAGYWDREVPLPTEFQADDPRVDADRQASLVEILGSHDLDAIEADVERVASGTHRSAFTATDLLDSSFVDSPPTPDASQLAEQVSSTGCLAANSAIALASAAREVLLDRDPDANWFIGEISEEQITGSAPTTPPADCFELYLEHEQNVPDSGRRPALILAPAWTG